MGAFLTGLAAAALLFAVTWITLDTYTVTTIERYDQPSVNIHGEDRGESWE
ncbi:hypothetical protein [Roseovarius spongiae]|uniref:hypothetical protein n=1 Tax=Roseovarius spongiae TaxID=2320272 RepID=UPI00140DA641|nr:hypothetical protein [Roseovarius spongiae]